MNFLKFRNEKQTFSKVQRPKQYFIFFYFIFSILLIKNTKDYNFYRKFIKILKKTNDKYTARHGTLTSGKKVALDILFTFKFDILLKHSDLIGNN